MKVCGGWVPAVAGIRPVGVTFLVSFANFRPVGQLRIPNAATSLDLQAGLSRVFTHPIRRVFGWVYGLGFRRQVWVSYPRSTAPERRRNTKGRDHTTRTGAPPTEEKGDQQHLQCSSMQNLNHSTSNKQL